MALVLNSLTVEGGNQGVVYDYARNLPTSVVVSDIQTGIVFFYDNENPNHSRGSIPLNHQTTSLTNYNGNFHFLTAIPIATPTGSGSDFSLIVGQNLAKQGQKVVNCANLNLTFSTNGQESTISAPKNPVVRNCQAIPNTETYLFQPFQIAGLNPAFDTVEISVPTGQNAGIQKDVTVFIYGDNNNLVTPLLAIINSNGDSFTCKRTTMGNIYIMAFIEPTPSLSGRKTVVTFETGDPATDSKITFDDDTRDDHTDLIDKTDSSGEEAELKTGSKNKGCLSFFGLW